MSVNMRKMQVDKLLVGAFELVLICVFAYTGFIKIIYLGDWVKKVEMISFIKALNIIGLIKLLPLIELIVALMISFDRFKPLGNTFAMFLMSLFIIYIVYDIYTNDGVNCACGGIFEALTLETHLLVNAILLTMTIVLNNRYRKWI